MLISIIETLTVPIMLLIFFSVSGCSLKQYKNTDNVNLEVCVNNPACRKILAIGHRGMGGTNWFIPENTLFSFEKAWLMGADGIELDVRQTKDGIPVIMHDNTVDRTTNGKGHVNQMTLAEIKALKIYSLGWASPVQTVPTLREVLAFLKGKMLLDLDIKDVNIFQVVKIIEEESMLDSAYLLIDNIDEGILARKANPKVALMPKVNNIEEARQFIDTLSPISIFEIGYLEASPDLVHFIHSQEIRVHIDALGYFDYLAPYGYRTLISHGADNILTDRLGTLVPFLHSIEKEKNKK